MTNASAYVGNSKNILHSSTIPNFSAQKMVASVTSRGSQLEHNDEEEDEKKEEEEEPTG